MPQIRSEATIYCLECTNGETNRIEWKYDKNDKIKLISSTDAFESPSSFVHVALFKRIALHVATVAARSSAATLAVLVAVL